MNDRGNILTIDYTVPCNNKYAIVKVGMYAIETGCVACVRMYGDRYVFLGEKMKPKTGDRTERKRDNAK